jgi:hypothetical protein
MPVAAVREKLRLAGQLHPAQVSPLTPRSSPLAAWPNRRCSVRRTSRISGGDSSQIPFPHRPRAPRPALTGQSVTSPRIRPSAGSPPTPPELLRLRAPSAQPDSPGARHRSPPLRFGVVPVVESPLLTAAARIRRWPRRLNRVRAPACTWGRVRRRAADYGLVCRRADVKAHRGRKLTSSGRNRHAEEPQQDASIPRPEAPGCLRAPPPSRQRLPANTGRAQRAARGFTDTNDARVMMSSADLARGHRRSGRRSRRSIPRL